MNEDNKDALNNLINSIQEKMSNSNGSDEEHINGSNNVDNTTNFDLSSILNAFGSNNNNNSNNTTDNTSQDTGFDPSILFKFQNIMKSMNNSNPQKNLLLSLKPFLRKSRQDKMNEYITILNVISMLESFKDKGSD